MDKCKAEPLVPIGALTTAAVLCGGLISFKRGDRKMGQYFMRARVIAQGATVVAMIGYGVSAGAIDLKPVQVQ
jgi:hypothetical protein